MACVGRGLTSIKAELKTHGAMGIASADEVTFAHKLQPFSQSGEQSARYE